jgi:hypothetical protein
MELRVAEVGCKLAVMNELFGSFGESDIFTLHWAKRDPLFSSII